jgi:hypothetical protein
MTLTIATGNHRVGPTIKKLATHNFILMAGTGANLASGLHPDFANKLTIQPRFDGDDASDSDDSAASI